MAVVRTLEVANDLSHLAFSEINGKKFEWIVKIRKSRELNSVEANVADSMVCGRQVIDPKIFLGWWHNDGGASTSGPIASLSPFRSEFAIHRQGASPAE
jgi:hypothetical protein